MCLEHEGQTTMSDSSPSLRDCLRRPSLAVEPPPARVFANGDDPRSPGPTPSILRDEARWCVQAVRTATDQSLKLQLAVRAFELAQRAEAQERAEHDPSLRQLPGPVTWPPVPAALAALLDLGLSVSSIAHYFRAPREEVTQLCDRYGLLPIRYRDGGNDGR
jgi:hypothetical protein